MTDTTDTAQVVHALRAHAKREWGIWSRLPHLMDEAADALERLAAENAELRKALSDCATAVGANAPQTCSAEFLCEVPREVMLVVNGLRMDALRYRWLRGSPDRRAHMPCVYRMSQLKPWELVPVGGSTMDKAIDAAMAEGKGDDV